MMIARPTPASAAAPVMTRNTNTWPPAPYTREKATNVRLTALSMSSTHMNRMMALRRVSTPTTPIENRTAEKNSASASIGPPLAQDHGADDRGQQHHARDLERQQVLVEQRPGDRGDRALGGHLLGRVSGRQCERLGGGAVDQREQLGQQPEAHRAGGELPAERSGIGDRRRLPEVEEHDHEQEHDH